VISLILPEPVQKAQCRNIINGKLNDLGTAAQVQLHLHQESKQKKKTFVWLTIRYPYVKALILSLRSDGRGHDSTCIKADMDTIPILHVLWQAAYVRMGDVVDPEDVLHRQGESLCSRRMLVDV
jgi:hypothetical protein